MDTNTNAPADLVEAVKEAVKKTMYRTPGEFDYVCGEVAQAASAAYQAHLESDVRPVAWMYELARAVTLPERTPCDFGPPQVTLYEPCVPDGAIRNLTPLYATPQPDQRNAEIARLREAASQLLDRMSSTYRAGNGRQVGIQGDDGEKCYIVHSDDIATLQAALAKDAPHA